MKDSTIFAVIDALDDKVYVTKQLLKHKAKLSITAVECVIELLIEDEKIDVVYVKNNKESGRAEVAYRKKKRVKAE